MNDESLFDCLEKAFWCNGCEGDLGETFWYHDLGSVHLTTCNDCGPLGGDEIEPVKATGKHLVDDKDGAEFVRIVRHTDAGDS